MTIEGFPELGGNKPSGKTLCKRCGSIDFPAKGGCIACARLSGKKLETLKIENQPMHSSLKNMGVNFLLLSSFLLLVFIIYKLVAN